MPSAMNMIVSLFFGSYTYAKSSFDPSWLKLGQLNGVQQREQMIKSSMPKRVPSHFSSNDQNRLGDPTNFFHTECFDLCEAFHQSNLKETPVILLSFKLRSNNAANREHEKGEMKK